MAETATPHKLVRLEDVITDTQAKQTISALDQPWQPERDRFTMASRLAYGLLGLFGLTIVCNGIFLTALIVTSAIPGAKTDPAGAIEQMMQLVSTLLPYIATPLGVALGFFFREPRGE